MDSSGSPSCGIRDIRYHAGEIILGQSETALTPDQVLKARLANRKAERLVASKWRRQNSSFPPKILHEKVKMTVLPLQVLNKYHLLSVNFLHTVYRLSASGQTPSGEWRLFISSEARLSYSHALIKSCMIVCGLISGSTSIETVKHWLTILDLYYVLGRIRGWDWSDHEWKNRLKRLSWTAMSKFENSARPYARLRSVTIFLYKRCYLNKLVHCYALYRCTTFLSLACLAIHVIRDHVIILAYFVLDRGLRTGTRRYLY